MDLNITMTCAQCGRPADEQTRHDGRGNILCHSCLEHLYGHSTHVREVPVLCERCGGAVETPLAKGRYCVDCVARLRGERPARRSAMPSAQTNDVAFEQMLADVLEPQPLAAAG